MRHGPASSSVFRRRQRLRGPAPFDDEPFGVSGSQQEQSIVFPDSGILQRCLYALISASHLRSVARRDVIDVIRDCGLDPADSRSVGGKSQQRRRGAGRTT